MMGYRAMNILKNIKKVVSKSDQISVPSPDQKTTPSISKKNKIKTKNKLDNCLLEFNFPM